MLSNCRQRVSNGFRLLEVGRFGIWVTDKASPSSECPVKNLQTKRKLKVPMTLYKLHKFSKSIENK